MAAGHSWDVIFINGAPVVGVIEGLSGVPSIVGGGRKPLELNLAAVRWTSWPEVRWRIRIRGKRKGLLWPLPSLYKGLRSLIWASVSARGKRKSKRIEKKRKRE